MVKIIGHIYKVQGITCEITDYNWTSTGKYCIGNSSDDSVTQLIHSLHFFLINSVFYKPLEENLYESDLENEGGQIVGEHCIDGVPPHFFIVFMPFCSESFLIIG